MLTCHYFKRFQINKGVCIKIHYLVVNCYSSLSIDQKSLVNTRFRQDQSSSYCKKSKENDGDFWDKIRAAEHPVEAKIGNACSRSDSLSDTYSSFRRISSPNIFLLLFRNPSLRHIALLILDILR